MPGGLPRYPLDEGASRESRKVPSKLPNSLRDHHDPAYISLFHGRNWRQWTQKSSSGYEMAQSDRWWSDDTLAVVTGANKGIGFEIVRQLGQKGITTVLTSRDVKRGEEAVKTLVAEGLPVVYHQLDVASAESAQTLADWLKEQYGAVDILINNAGVLDDSASSSFNTNYYGVKHVTSRILPLLRASEAGARVLIVSSRRGLLQSIVIDSLRQRLHDADQLSEGALDELVLEYFAELKSDTDSPWMESNYGLTKAFVNAYTRVLANKLAARPAGQKIYVNSFCPGFTTTDMAAPLLQGPSGAQPLPPGYVWRSPEEAAGDAVWQTLLPARDMPSGIFSAERVKIAF